MGLNVDVFLWGREIGSLIENSNGLLQFRYDNNFLQSKVELSPIHMPLSGEVYSFPMLAESTFHGLPGLFAESLPDKFGMTLINEYLSGLGRDEKSFGTLEKLCYIGNRGMGALEYKPAKGMDIPDQSLDVDKLSALADKILSAREDIRITADEQAVGQLLKIGTSAGGARAKALIAWNEKTQDIRSGQINAGDGYGYWLLKFGELENNRDKDIKADGKEYSRVEYAYSLMCKDAGIDMSECRLLCSAEGTHFMTRRFDRNVVTGEKIHMQSLGNIAHFDFNDPGAYGYEDAAYVMRRIGLQQIDIEQLFRRMIFNEVSKNYDDHVKNISFLMDKSGKWSLAPAYDVTFSYNPNSMWTGRHQMRINGKMADLQLDDLFECAKHMNIRRIRAERIIQEVISTVKHWPDYAEKAGIKESIMQRIQMQHMTSYV